MEWDIIENFNELDILKIVDETDRTGRHLKIYLRK